MIRTCRLGSNALRFFVTQLQQTAYPGGGEMMKAMRWVVLAVGVFFSSALYAQSGHSMFVPANMEWKESPVTEGLQIAEDAELFIFNRDHTYAHISGVLYKSKVSGAITICAGCGFSSEKGTWNTSAPSAVLVRYRLAHSGIKTNRKPRWKREKWQLHDGASPLNAKRIQTSKVELVPFNSLGNPEIVAALLRDDK